jgi:hypothetical protein
MRCYAQAGHLTPVEDLYYDLLAREIQPDVQTFQILMQAICENKAASAAKGRKLLTRMASLGVLPSRHFFHLYLKAWGKPAGISGSALKEVVEAMEKHGLSPDADTYNVLLQSYLGRALHEGRGSGRQLAALGKVE